MTIAAVLNRQGTTSVLLNEPNLPAYANIPGASGDYLSTPNSGALGITGDIEIWARINPTSWINGGLQVIAGKWETSGQLSWIFYINATGHLALDHSTNGTASFSDVGGIPGFTNGSGPHWVKVSRVAATGVSVFSVLTVESAEIAGIGAWSLLSTVGGTSGALFNGTSLVSSGAFNAGTQNPLIGQIFRVVIWNGLSTNAGTIVANFNAARANLSTTLVATTGETWTRNGTVTFAPPPTSVLTVSPGTAASTTVRLGL